MVAITLSTIRGPRKQEDAELSKQATQWIRERVHQHDIEFDIKEIDKSSSFIGNVWITINGYKTNVATLLLEQGYARVYDSDPEHAAEYSIAEETAKKARKHMWANYDQELEKEKERKKKDKEEDHGQGQGQEGQGQGQGQGPKQTKSNSKDVIVTEIVDAGLFYVQIPSESGLEELMKNIKEENLEAAPQHTPAVGELVAAKFTEDDTWYRARVKSDQGGSKYLVFYVDYGNSEILAGDRVRQLPKKYQNTEPQAFEASLAYIKPPIGNEEFADEAAYSLKEMVWTKTMFASIEYQEKDRLFLSLGDRDSQIHVNAALLRSGLARIDKFKRKTDKNARSLLDKLHQEERQARSAHLNLWRYGDIGSDDDDDKPKQKDKKGAAKPTKGVPAKAADKKSEGKKE